VRSRPRLLFVVTEDWYFHSHRRSLGLAARRAGFDVVVACRVARHRAALEADGFRVVPIRLRRSSRNPFRELGSILELTRIFRRERPAVIHSVAFKPVIYGAIAAWLARLGGADDSGIIHAIAGLGHVFVAKGFVAALRRRVFTLVFRAAFAGSRTRVLFQNPEDREALVASRAVPFERTAIVRGVGVDPAEFRPRPLPPGPPIVLLAARLLWTKGIRELVEATRRLRARGIPLRTVLAGEPDDENPSAVPRAVLEEWSREGTIEWWGRRDDMPTVLGEASIVALPTTYGEGVPRALIEAAACARPIVATDVAGCREIVRHGENGLLVAPGDSTALEGALARLLGDSELRARLGANGRAIVERDFTADRANEATISLYREVLGPERASRLVPERESVPAEGVTG
jgi:glycosyltransferase involved in cell wall biosynthesis